jgi:vancomycin resistance protein YoaR
MPDNTSEWRKEYYEKNKEKMQAASREYYAKNKAKCQAAVRANYLKNLKTDPNHYNKKSNQYYLKAKGYYQEYYKQNRDMILERQKAYYNQHKFDSHIYPKASSTSIKQASIEAQLAGLLVKKEAFKKKLAEEAAAKNNVDIV